MAKFLSTYHLSILNQEEIEKLNRQITTNEVEAVVKNLTKDKSPEANGITDDLYQKFKELTPTLLKLLLKIQEKVRIQSSFYDCSKSKPRQGHYKKENYRPISLMNVDAKIVNKILANQIQQYIKRYHTH